MSDEELDDMSDEMDTPFDVNAFNDIVATSIEDEFLRIFQNGEWVEVCPVTIKRYANGVVISFDVSTEEGKRGHDLLLASNWQQLNDSDYLMRSPEDQHNEDNVIPEATMDPPNETDV